MSNKYLRGPRAATAFVSRMVNEMPTVKELMDVESDNAEMNLLIAALKNAAVNADYVRSERKDRRAGQQAERRANKPKRGSATYSGILRTQQSAGRTIRQRNASRKVADRAMQYAA